MNRFLYFASKSSEVNISYRRTLDTDRGITKAQDTARMIETERTYSTC